MSGKVATSLFSRSQTSTMVEEVSASSEQVEMIEQMLRKAQMQEDRTAVITVEQLQRICKEVGVRFAEQLQEGSELACALEVSDGQYRELLGSQTEVKKVFEREIESLRDRIRVLEATIANLQNDAVVAQATRVREVQTAIQAGSAQAVALQQTIQSKEASIKLLEGQLASTTRERDEATGWSDYYKQQYETYRRTIQKEVNDWLTEFPRLLQANAQAERNNPNNKIFEGMRYGLNQGHSVFQEFKKKIDRC